MFRNHNRFLMCSIIVGILIRLIVAPYTYNVYDSPYWAGLFSSFENGLMLYESEMYWYPPVWGFVLATLTFLTNLLGIVPYEGLFENIVDGEILTGRATVTTPVFNLFVKIPVMMADLVVAWIIYLLLKERTGSEKKASYGFSIWFLSPLTIWVSSVHGQFESVAIMFMMMSIYFILKDRYLLSGIAISLSIFTKVFPVLLVPIMLAYILSKRNDKRIWNVASFLLGAVVIALMVCLPSIVYGESEGIINFLTGRVDRASSMNPLEGGRMDMFSPWNLTYFIPFIAIIVIFLSYLTYKTPEDERDPRFLEICLLSICSLYIWIFAPPQLQYILLSAPLFILVMFISRYDLRYPMCAFIAIGFVLGLCSDGFFYPLGAYTGIVSLDTLIDLVDFLRTFTVDLYIWINMGASAIVGLWVFYKLLCRKKERRVLNEDT